MKLPQGKIMARGDLLPLAIQDHCLRAYVHRFTRQHVPQWSKKPRDNGEPYPVQFASDSEWLARTLFPVTVSAKGVIKERSGACWSNASWPDNPELRKTTVYRVDVPEYEESF